MDNQSQMKIIEELRKEIRQTKEVTERLEHKYVELSQGVRRLSNPICQDAHSRPTVLISWETLRPAQTNSGWELPANSEELHLLGTELQDILPKLEDIQDIHNLEMVLHILSLGEEIPQPTRRYAYNMGRMLKTALQEGWNRAADQSNGFSRHLHQPSLNNPIVEGVDVDVGLTPVKTCAAPVLVQIPSLNLPEPSSTASVPNAEAVGLGVRHTTSSESPCINIKVEPDVGKQSTDEALVTTKSAVMSPKRYTEICMLLDLFIKQSELLHPSPESWSAYRQVNSVVKAASSSESVDVDANFIHGLDCIFTIYKESMGPNTPFNELQCIASLGLWLQLNIASIGQPETDAFTPKRKSLCAESGGTPSKVSRSIDFSGNNINRPGTSTSINATSVSCGFKQNDDIPCTSSANNITNVPVGPPSRPIAVGEVLSPVSNRIVDPMNLLEVSENIVGLTTPERQSCNVASTTAVRTSTPAIDTNNRRPLTNVESKRAGKIVRGIQYCYCGQPALTRITSTPTSRYFGRPYISCCMPHSNKNRCDYYRWEDEPTLPVRKKCSMCGNAGHNKKNCPNNDTS